MSRPFQVVAAAFRNADSLSFLAVAVLATDYALYLLLYRSREHPAAWVGGVMWSLVALQWFFIAFRYAERSLLEEGHGEDADG